MFHYCQEKLKREAEIQKLSHKAVDHLMPSILQDLDQLTCHMEITYYLDQIITDIYVRNSHIAIAQIKELKKGQRQ